MWATSRINGARDRTPMNRNFEMAGDGSVFLTSSFLSSDLQIRG
jgi:hypothetical protein